MPYCVGTVEPGMYSGGWHYFFPIGSPNKPQSFPLRRCAPFFTSHASTVYHFIHFWEIEKRKLYSSFWSNFTWRERKDHWSPASPRTWMTTSHGWGEEKVSPKVSAPGTTWTCTVPGMTIGSFRNYHDTNEHYYFRNASLLSVRQHTSKTQPAEQSFFPCRRVRRCFA